jgi:hypothetical protein
MAGLKKQLELIGLAQVVPIAQTTKEKLDAIKALPIQLVSLLSNLIC